MFKNYLNSIEGIATYPVFSLLVFFIFFVIMAVWLIRSDKKHLHEISEMPLDKNEPDLFI